MLPSVPYSEAAVFDLDGGLSIDMAQLHEREGHGDATRTTKSLKASICLKLTIFVGLLVVLASGAPALVLWLKAHEQLVQEIERRLLTVSTLRQEQLKDYLLSETDKAELIATRVIINNFLANKTDANRTLAEFDLRSAVEVITDFTSAAIYDHRGRLSFATDQNAFETAIQPTDLDTLRSNGLKLALPIQTNTGWMYNISRAIFQNRVLIGVLMTWVNAAKLEHLVYDRTGLQGTGELLIGIPEEGLKLVHLLFPPQQSPNLTLLP